jgi:CRISPR-associated protein Csy3
MAKSKNIASVLAFEKKLVPSDGFLYETVWDMRTNPEASKPLGLREKSVRGTISNRLKANIKNDPLKLNAEVEKPNLQKVDSCALSPDSDTLKMQFTLKILSGVQQPSACNNQEFNRNYSKAANNYIAEEGFNELARRYATNISSARFLWRNRVGAEAIEVHVKSLSKGVELNLVFNALGINLREFDNESEDIKILAANIADALSGKTDYLLLEIQAYALVGKAQDVYPSEELVLDKGNSKGGKSKVLYSIGGIAGIHSQKIGNALRTIDTWYPEFDDANIGPIAVEPYGAVTNLGKAYRNPKNKSDFFTLFDKFASGEKLPEKEDEHYVMAVLVRGGVFGESGKE